MTFVHTPAGTPRSSCTDAGDCTGMDGAKHCYEGQCHCRKGFHIRVASCCIKPAAGDVGEGLSGEPDPASLLTMVSFEPGRCKSLCRVTADCLLIVIATADDQPPTCALFSGVRASEDVLIGINHTHMSQGTSGSGHRAGFFTHFLEEHYSKLNHTGTTSMETVEVHVFRFKPDTGDIPSQYIEDDDGRRFFLSRDSLNAKEGAELCAREKGIVFPASSLNDTKTVKRLLQDKLPDDLADLLTEKDQLVYVGLDRQLTEHDASMQFASSESKPVAIQNWGNGQPESERCVAVMAETDKMHDVPCEREFPVICQFVGANIAAGREWEQDDRNATVDLGGVYQVHGVRYAGSWTKKQVVKVTTSLEIGQEMFCTEAMPEMAAPEGLYRLLTCDQVTFGRYVHLHFERNRWAAEYLAVFGIFIRGL